MKLKRAAIIQTGLRLLNEVGVDGLSTRRLAVELGVQSPALYWHFKSKQALLDALATAILDQGHTCRFPQAGQDWKEFLASNARSFRRALRAYRDGARVHAGSNPEVGQFPGVEAQIKHLCDAGFSAGDAIRVGILVGRYVVGWVLEEQVSRADVTKSFEDSCVDYPHLHAGVRALRCGNPDADFEFGLSVVIAGLASHLQRRST